MRLCVSWFFTTSEKWHFITQEIKWTLRPNLFPLSYYCAMKFAVSTANWQVTACHECVLYLLATPGMCSSAQQPRTHLCTCWWPLAWRGAPTAGLAWAERHELWALSAELTPSSCVSDEDWVRHRHQWASVICTIPASSVTAAKLSAALLRTQSPECYEDGRRPQQQHTVHRWLLGPAAEGQKAACRFPQCLHPHGETPRWRWVMNHDGARPLHHASWDAASSVILDIAVTNKGVSLKNYSEQILLSLSSGRHRACLSPARDQVWCGQRAAAWWRWGVVFWSLSRHYFHLRVNGCMRAWAAKRACIGVFRIISQSDKW